MKRYALSTPRVQKYPGPAVKAVVERPEGEWVRFEDVAPLIAALRDLTEKTSHLGHKIGHPNQTCTNPFCVSYRTALEALAKAGGQ